MSWRPVDCHAHTKMSDGFLTVQELIERAQSLGVRPSVADHVSHELAFGIRTLAEVVTYLDTLEQFDVLRGGEFCWQDRLWRELPPELALRFTHRVGSLHAIQLADGRWLSAFSPQLPDGITPDDYMESLIANLERLAHEMPVDILAHPTLAPEPVRAEPPETMWTPQRVERAVTALHSAGIAFEISNRYRPHESLVRAAVDGGVRISLGSDGHTREQVADVSFPLELARSLGVTDTDLYDPERHGSRTGEAPARYPA